MTEDFSFDKDTLVFKADNKIFLLTNLTSAQTFNLKCKPEKAIAKEEFEDFKPGFHMNKQHWNTICYN